MNRVVTCVLAGAMALSLHSAAAWAQEQEEAPPVESNPTPLAETDPAEYVDLLAEGKNGEVLGIVFDVVLDDAGNAKTIVVELFAEEEMEPVEGAEGEEPMEAPEGDPAATDTVEEEPEPLAPEEGAEGEGTEEPVFVGRLVGVSPKGGMIDMGRGMIALPSITAENVDGLDDFEYEAGMKTVAHPEGYPAEEAAEE